MKARFLSDILKHFFVIALIFLQNSCGSNEVGTGVSNPPTSTSTKSAAAAISAIFNSEENESISALIAWSVQQSAAGQESSQQMGCGSNDPACTCTSVEGSGDQPSGVETTPYTNAGTYGSTGNTVTVDEDDFCEMPDGTPNSGSGPDSNGLFAAFELIGDVDMDCDGSSIAMKSGSVGVFRNTLASGDTPAYMPQIFGSFTFEVDGSSSATVNCTIYLSEGESMAFSDCTDENGETVEQEEGASCQF